MENRKRINMSVDPATYERLKNVVSAYGFRNVCELLLASARILIDRLQPADSRLYVMPDDDGAYIDGMFEELSRTERQPDGTVPKRKKQVKLT